MGSFSGVLFDLDGTLLDSAQNFIAILDQMLKQRQLPALEPSLVQSHASSGAMAMLAAAFTPHGWEQLDQAQLHEEFLARYDSHLQIENRLYDGIDELLSWLDQEQIPWGIVTNKSERFTRPIVHQLKLSERCRSLVCPEQVSRQKPDPEPLLLGCRELGQSPASTLYLGDHRRDIEAGRRAGMRTICCDYGYIQPEENPAEWGADYRAENARELMPLLQCLYNTSL